MRIPIEQQVIAICFSVVLLAITVHLVRKHRLREQHALIWLGASVTIFVLTIFDRLVEFLAGLFAVSYAPTLILVFGLLYCIVILLSQSVTISTQADRIRDLAQSVGILEWRMRQMESSYARPSNNNGGLPVDQGISHKEEAGVSMGVEGQKDLPQVQNGKHTDHARVAGQSQATAALNNRAQPKRPNRVLVIGLDGATFDLIKPWSAAGRLPTLTRLMSEGAYGTLTSTVPPMTGPAWTSFATGVNPGKHRLYDWIAREPGSYTFSPVTALDCTAPTLYSLLSDAGRRVCALNIPMTYPPVPVNGVMVSGMPAPSTKVTFTYPKMLHQEIVDAVGDYILYPDPGQAYSDSGVDAFLERLYRTTDLRMQTLQYLKQREAWDFAMVVLNGTDTICHALWKYMDKTHPLHDPDKAAKYGNAIQDYYEYVDGAMASMVDNLDEDTTLIVMSDHGFGPFHKFIHVNNWLLAEGFMQVRRSLGIGLKHALFRSGFTPMNVYDNLMRFGLGALKREVVRGQGQGMLKKLFLSFEDVDWTRTEAYSLGNVGQIYLNVQGREPFGCVQPGAEYERVRDRIIARLAMMKDPATGEAVVETVYRREEIYAGDQFAHAPDIVFLPTRLEYFGFGEYEFGSHQIIESMRRGISGTHRMNGIFMAYGAAVKQGVQTQNASLYDLAPTILHLMGEEIPEHMDGRVLQEVLAEKPAALRQRAGTASPSARDGHTTKDAGLSEEDKRILAERLRNLGYVG